MNILDVLICVILLFGIWKGWNSGILMQLSGIVGIIAGAWVATAFSDKVVEWFDVGQSNEMVVFVVVVIVVMIGVIVLLKLLDKLLNWSGLSFPIKLLGSIFCVVKYIVVLAFMLSCYAKVTKYVDKPIDKDGLVVTSAFYEPLKSVSDVVFPFLLKEFEVAKITQKFNPSKKQDQPNTQTPDSDSLQDSISKRVVKELLKDI